MVVVTIIVILVSMAIPIYNRTILRAKETVLKSNLFTLRTQINHYVSDKQKAPQSLDDLVREGYLLELPADPIGGNNQWRTVSEDPILAVNQMEPGILTVRSFCDKLSTEGTTYAEW
jgi:general secretion pathway protein G